MLGVSNPFQDVLDLIEECMLLCTHAEARINEVHSHPVRVIASEIHTAKNTLSSAQSTAALWRDSFNYHVDGGHPCTDF